ncbi:helix-hairpin-helix domain-containing protein [Azoarcus sp. L1K30]|uniref:ComEA family DNA-binding protein n=1 Tax=Azoarcus sp. L1K30 TaxID=2820277 RepID=UPI001B80F878|nr:helix-hairpin-helix domain-containing protein [Azoarcus sp. L1K30]MBR0567006.1 helix-hairpin-helix domain-containing protein [Azoarcus sp. L1K30]
MPYQDNSTQPFFPTPVQIGGTHRYVVNGDEVTLEAELHVVDPVAAGYLNWSLQLWADEVLVADAFFGALYPDSFGIARVGATTAANLPAGTGEHRMTLALAGDDGAGLQRFDAVSYPRHEHFPLPRIEGAVAYRFEEDHTEISAESVRNPRPADNMSGSLVLELWALPAAYQGGAFSGILIGSEFIGALAGQSQWNNICARLPACELPEGRWHLVLMLREWVGHTYLTRDYRNFALMVDGPLPAPKAAPAVDVAAQPTTVDETVAASTEAAEAKADLKPATKAAPKAAVKKKTAAAASATTAAAPVTAAKRNAKQSTPAHKLARVSVNMASVSDLSAVRGVNSATAEGIVAGRPWKSLDDLIAVKGIGSKSLDKLKPLLKL